MPSCCPTFDTLSVETDFQFSHLITFVSVGSGKDILTTLSPLRIYTETDVGFCMSG